MALPRLGKKSEQVGVKSDGLLLIVPGPEQRPDALATLAQAAAAGERAAIRTFILTIGPSLLRVVRRVLGPGHSDVDDVTQECTVAVMDALPGRRE
jgi:Sigma-70 region 2